MVAGFQRVFEDAGGKIVQKLFPPLTVPDYGTYLAQMKTNIDGIFLGFAGSKRSFPLVPPVQRIRAEGKIKRRGRHDRVRRGGAAQHGRRGAGRSHRVLVFRPSSTTRSTQVRAAFRAEAKYDPGFYGRRDLRKRGGLPGPRWRRSRAGSEDKEAFMKALRALRVDTCRGPVTFDAYGNVVGNVYIRKVERKEGRLVNSVIHTYPNVSQFWNLQARGVPEEPGVLARLAAGEESGAVIGLGSDS